MPSKSLPKDANDRAPFLEGVKVLEAPPRDHGLLVYFIALLHGIGVLMPWNMFITIAPQYYVDYWFSPNGTQTDYSKNFMSSLGIAAQLPTLLINIINTFAVIGCALLLRIAGPIMINCASVFAVIMLITFVSPTEEAMGWFYVVTLIIVAIINLSNGLYQNSTFGLFADFPAKYTNALVLGNNICGTFTTVLSIVVTMILSDVRSIAVTYFSISLFVLSMCGFSLIVLVKQKFYNYHIEKGNAARAQANTSKPGLSQFVECFKMCWVQLFNVFFIFFVTLTIFPAMMAATPLYMESNQEWHSIWPERLYTFITCFLSFNLFATVGSMIANFVQWPRPKFLWIPVLLRGFLIPFFMFCNYRPFDRTLPVLFKSEFVFLSGGILMAVTSGYFSSLAMMYAPRVCPERYAKIAGMTAALCLIIGVFSGVSFTLVVAYITTMS
ncbi:Nucleoside Transporter [Necator americanus]|uniref:Nucleoside Transporter n=1 Tax=Necator americanus TaxID=51031 RepID=W2U1H9_NECAM|nr:Nucleoside Transporter [Necator americanus]ETN87187.1 Nucleoside Transporter [Necator americanus]